MRHIAIVLLCALVTVSSAFRVKFGFNRSRWLQSSSSSSRQERQNRECLKYRSGRLLSLLLENGCMGTFSDALDSVCQCVDEDMKVCIELTSKTGFPVTVIVIS